MAMTASTISRQCRDSAYCWLLRKFNLYYIVLKMIVGKYLTEVVQRERLRKRIAEDFFDGRGVASDKNLTLNEATI